MTENKKTKLIEEINLKLEPKNMVVSEIKEEEEGDNIFLNIEIDSTELFDLNKMQEVFKIVEPICNKINVIDGEYILNIYSKEKKNEQ